MRPKEYAEKNNISMAELAKIVGCSVSNIYRLDKGSRGVGNKQIAAKLTELGIYYKPYYRGDKSKKMSDFIYQENLHIEECPIGEIYCYSIDRVNEITKYLNNKKICYYVRAEQWYWLVKYDATLNAEEWLS